MSKELRRENRGSLNSGSSEQCGSRMNDDQELIQVQVPFADGKTKELRVGQRLLLNGVIYGARDAAHLRLIEVLEKGEDPPVDLRLQVIYYVGPTLHSRDVPVVQQVLPPAAVWTDIPLSCWNMG